MMNIWVAKLINCSLGCESGSPLIVVIFEVGLLVSFLLLLSGPCAVGDISQSTLVLAVGKNLLSAQVLLLLSPESLCVLLILLRHFSLTHLLWTLVHDCPRLLRVESLEVIGLDTVRSQHWLLSLWVLSHKVVIIGVINIGARLELLVSSLGIVLVALLFGHLGVGILHGLLHGGTCGWMLVLRLVKQVVEVQSLLIVCVLIESLLVRIELTLADLLVNPVLLL